jgi:ABC-type multidrug transport system fused ATPase/permease subunit
MPNASFSRLGKFIIGRVTLNVLDLVGLAGVVVLASAFGSLVQAKELTSNFELPLIGSIEVTERFALILALGVVATFVVKSSFSIWLKLRTAMFVASLEVNFSSTLARDYFSGASDAEDEFDKSLSEFQNVSMTSTEGLAQFINARASAITELTLLAFLVSTFLFVNPLATAFMFIYLAGVLYALSRIVTLKIQKNGIKTMQGSREVLSKSRDLFGVRREVRAAGVLKTWIGQFATSRSKTATGKAAISTLNSLPRYVVETSLVVGIFVFIGLVVLVSDLESQAVTIGVFMAGGLRLVALLIPLQTSINDMILGARRGRFALDRLVRISKSETIALAQGERSSTRLAIGLEFQTVTFGYTAEIPVIHAVSFKVDPGQKVAIVGPSGSGKSTLFELATGFREAQSGQVSLSGSLPRRLLAAGNGAIGIVPQRPHLITGTISENVSLLPNEPSDEAQVVACLEAAGLPQFCKTEMLGLQVEPDSGQLSGGEIQRLGIARALYRNPEILFLDEATSSLDAKTESQISAVLDQLRGKMTIVLIAHRLSTVKSADKIIYLNQGRVVAEGTFKQLQESVPDFDRAVKLMGLD